MNQVLFNGRLKISVFCRFKLNNVFIRSLWQAHELRYLFISKYLYKVSRDGYAKDNSFLSTMFNKIDIFVFLVYYIKHKES